MHTAISWPKLYWWVMRALALCYCEKNCATVSAACLCACVCVCASTCMCIIERQRDNQTLRGQRVLEVRDELSLASAVCACVMVELQMHLCVISAAIWRYNLGRIRSELGTDVTGPSLSPSPARSFMCSHRAKKTPRLPGICNYTPTALALHLKGCSKAFLEWFKCLSHVVLTEKAFLWIISMYHFTPISET